MRRPTRPGSTLCFVCWRIYSCLCLCSSARLQRHGGRLRTHSDRHRHRVSTSSSSAPPLHQHLLFSSLTQKQKLVLILTSKSAALIKNQSRKQNRPALFLIQTLPFSCFSVLCPHLQVKSDTLNLSRHSLEPPAEETSAFYCS